MTTRINSQETEFKNKLDKIIHNAKNHYLLVIPTTTLTFLENVFCLLQSPTTGDYQIKTVYQFITEPMKDFEILMLDFTPNKCAMEYSRIFNT